MAGRVAGFGGFGNQRGVHLATAGGEPRQDRGLAALQEQPSVTGDGGPGADRLGVALHAVPAQRPVQVDGDVAHLSGRVVGALEGLAAGDDPAPDSR